MNHRSSTLLIAALLSFGHVHAAVTSGLRQRYQISELGNGGYINRQGEVVIPRQFHYAGPFSEGLAFVILDEEGRCGYIDEQGKFVIGPQKDWDWGWDFSEGIARVSWNLGMLSEPGTTDHDYAYIDRSGRYISDRRFRFAADFHEELASVLVDSMFGYIDRRGRIAIRPRFGEARAFSEGLALVSEEKVTTGAIIHKKPRLYIDRRGRRVFAERDSMIFRGNFKDGLAPFMLPGIGGKSGYIDRRGRVTISARFELTYQFSEGRGMILDSGRIGWVSLSGEVVIPPQYKQRAGHGFSEGLAAVLTDSGWGYIDTSGRMVIPARFDRAGDFSDGFASVLTTPPGGKQYEAYIDRNGQYVWTSRTPQEEPKRAR